MPSTAFVSIAWPARPARPARTPRTADGPRRLAAGLLAGIAAVLSGCATAPASERPAAPAAGFPTADRVIFVQQCMQDHRGPYFEMVNKCACAIDTIARELSFDDYTTLSTEANALTIGGERGSVLRDNEAIGPHARQLRERIARAKQSCFIRP